MRKPYKCPICGKPSSRSDYILAHMRKKHPEHVLKSSKMKRCMFCDEIYHESGMWNHVTIYHKSAVMEWEIKNGKNWREFFKEICTNDKMKNCVAGGITDDSKDLIAQTFSFFKDPVLDPDVSITGGTAPPQSSGPPSSASQKLTELSQNSLASTSAFSVASFPTQVSSQNLLNPISQISSIPHLPLGLSEKLTFDEDSQASSSSKLEPTFEDFMSFSPPPEKKSRNGEVEEAETGEAKLEQKPENTGTAGAEDHRETVSDLVNSLLPSLD